MAQIATFYDHIKDISHQEKIPLLEAMREAKRLGVELLEVSQNNVIGREDELGRELSYVGLGISSIPAYFDFGRNPDVDGQSEPVLEAARYLGADKLLVIPGFFAPEDGPEERERQTESMISCINRLAEKAAGYGVSLTMEDFDNRLAPFSTVAGVRRFLDSCPGLSCCFDTGNFLYSGEDLGQAYDSLRGRVGHVHLKDRAYAQNDGEPFITAVDGKKLYPCPVGSGVLELGEIVARLGRDGYDGAYTIEHYGSPSMLNYLKQSAAWVKARLAEII